MSGRRTAPRVLILVAVMATVVAMVGFIVTLMLNAFVLDKYSAYGEVPIPGSGSLHLPAGEVTVSFHTLIVGSTSGNGLPVPDLKMTIDPPAGVAQPKVAESIGSTTTVNNNARRRVLVMQVPEEGTYHITTDGTVSPFISPRLAFGHSSSYRFLTPVFIGLFGLGVLGLIIALVWSSRLKRRAAPVSYGEPYTPTDEGIRVQQLKTIASLRDSGALTQEEFEAEKRRILDGL
jgi:Short C-terminal domain